MTPEGEPPIGESLRDELGTPRTVRRLASSPRSRVWPVEFDAAPAIVKQIVDGADAAACRPSAATRPDGRLYRACARRHVRELITTNQ